MIDITINGKYAYHCDPTTSVRILCVDAPGNYPVISISASGTIGCHKPDGKSAGIGGRNLVPMPRNLGFWFLVNDKWVLVGGPYENEDECLCDKKKYNPLGHPVFLSEGIENC